MKKIISVITALVCCMTFLGSCAEKNDTVSSLEGTYTKDLAGTTLKVYNWGEYISDGADDTLDVNAAFEKATGIKVEYSMYNDNEGMYSMLSSGATYYDIIIPSDYMIQRLVAEDMLREIDMSRLSNYKYIDEQYKDLYFDPENKFSVPYNVGMVGLVYNTKMVEEAPTSWSVLWDERYSGNILTFDNPRDSFAIAQLLLGQDVNTTDRADWDAAANKLKEQSPLLQMRVMDEVFNKMEGNNAAIAPYYAGDCLSMIENNPDLAFVYPEEGSNIFCDSICIPKNSQNYEAALLYINFLLEPEVALANAEYLYYVSPNTAVRENEEYSLHDSEVLYPSKEILDKAQWFENLDEELLGYYEELWIEVKNS